MFRIQIQVKNQMNFDNITGNQVASVSKVSLCPSGRNGSGCPQGGRSHYDSGAEQRYRTVSARLTRPIIQQPH